MARTMPRDLPPIFVRANFSFVAGDKVYTFRNQGVSLFGISGLKWPHFDPIKRVGTQVTVNVDVLGPHSFRFSTLAALTCELTAEAVYLGMKFILREAHRERLLTAIVEDGYYPSEYIRRFPRIPASSEISSMPIRAIAKVEGGSLIALDLSNMSPNGILLQTESPQAGIFIPGGRLEAQVEPRGEILNPFTFEGTISRIVMDKNLKTGNVTRYLGVKFDRIAEAERQNFLVILQAVLNNIQQARPRF